MPNNLGILPGKIFEYLAARKPIICVGPAGSDADDILRQCGAGQAFPYLDYAAMLAYLENLVAQWQTTSNLDLPGNAHTRYSRRALTEQLVELL